MAAPESLARQGKDQLRASILASRALRSAEERVAAGQRIAEIALPHLARASTVAAYLSFGTEPSTGELIAALLERRQQVVVPVVDGELLDWVAFDPADLPTPGALGIPSPSGPRLGVETLSQVDAVLVPALAADRDGNRLGRGRGYYDRALAAVACPLIAVVYDEDLVASVPVEPHDRRVDAVLTPSAWIDLARR